MDDRADDANKLGRFILQNEQRVMDRGRWRQYCRKDIKAVMAGTGEEDLMSGLVLHGEECVMKFKETLIVSTKFTHRDKIFGHGGNMK